MAYTVRTSGVCTHRVQTPAECRSAAASLGVPDQPPNVSPNLNVPAGCWTYNGDGLNFNPSSHSSWREPSSLDREAA